MDVEQEITKLIAEKLSLDPLTVSSETNLTNLGLQSLDIIEMIFAIEEKFDIEVPNAEGDAGLAFDTVGDVVRSVMAVMPKNA